MTLLKDGHPSACSAARPQGGKGRKVIAAFLTVILLLVFAQNCARAAEPELLGDVNGDGRVNLLDVAMLFDYRKGNTELSEEQLLRGDATGDGSITLGDVSAVYQLYLEYGNKADTSEMISLLSQLPRSGSGVTVTEGSTYYTDLSITSSPLEERPQSTYSEVSSSVALEDSYQGYTSPGAHPYTITSEGYLKQVVLKRVRETTDYYVKGISTRISYTRTVNTPVTYIWQSYRQRVSVYSLAPLADREVQKAFVSCGWSLYFDTDLIALDGARTSARVFGVVRTAEKDISLRDADTVYHELGHFIDYRFFELYGEWASYAVGFGAIPESEWSNLADEYTISNMESDAREQFSCLYDCYCRNRGEMQAACPQAYQYIQFVVGAIAEGSDGELFEAEDNPFQGFDYIIAAGPAEEPPKGSAEGPTEEVPEAPAVETPEEPIEESAEEPAEGDTEGPAEEPAEGPAEESTEEQYGQP